jgi:FAD-dependent halogenase
MKQPEILIAGAGPAGSSAAIALASRGRKVTILERERFPRTRIGESLPPKITPLLGALGVLEAVDRAGFVRMKGTTVCQGADILSHPFDPLQLQQGYQVERARFDRILLDRAIQAGAQVVEGATITDVIKSGDGSVIGLRAKDENGKESEWFARFSIDATGPASAIARALNVRRREEIRTVALAGYWRGARTPTGFAAEDTLFEMLPEGWVWSLIRSDGLRNVTVGVDASALKMRGSRAWAIYTELLSTSRLIAPLVDGATLEGELSAHDATWQSAERFIGSGFLLAGDAASFIDPLTSQGVVKAIQSGLTAAAVIETMISRPDDRRLAEEHHQRSEAAIFERYAEVAATFYRASPHVDRPFWSARVRPRPSAAPAPEIRAGRRLAFLEEVRARGGRAIRVERRPALAIASRPALEGGLVVPRPSLVAGPLDPVPLPQTKPAIDGTLLAAILDGATLEEIFESYAVASRMPRSSELGKSLLSTIAVLAELDLVSWQIRL